MVIVNINVVNNFSPKPIELTAANEEILIENIEVFRKNGFNFAINVNGNYTTLIRDNISFL